MGIQHLSPWIYSTYLVTVSAYCITNWYKHDRLYILSLSNYSYSTCSRGTSCSMHECLCVIQFNITFNLIYVISWQGLLVADIVLPHWNAISQAPDMDIYKIHWCWSITEFVPGSIRLSQKDGILSLCYWLAPTSADDWLKKGRHVLLCLCNNACKRSLAICCMSRALCPVSRLLSVPIWPACVKQGR